MESYERTRKIKHHAAFAALLGGILLSLPIFSHADDRNQSHMNFIIGEIDALTAEITNIQASMTYLVACGNVNSFWQGDLDADANPICIPEANPGLEVHVTSTVPQCDELEKLVWDGTIWLCEPDKFTMELMDARSDIKNIAPGAAATNVVVKSGPHFK